GVEVMALMLTVLGHGQRHLHAHLTAVQPGAQLAHARRWPGERGEDLRGAGYLEVVVVRLAGREGDLHWDRHVVEHLLVPAARVKAGEEGQGDGDEGGDGGIEHDNVYTRTAAWGLAPDANPQAAPQNHAARGASKSNADGLLSSAASRRDRFSRGTGSSLPPT